MAANLNGNTQSYQPFALRILQGLQPDVVCIQEFNYNNNTAADFRSFLDTSLGTNYTYFRESSSFQIPNGVISRYPIIASGSWADTVQSQPNRGFAWARIDLPGTNDLYVVSVHLLTSSASNRAAEANNLKALMLANFPANAWIVVAGDFNADPRTEACITTFGGYLTDNPIPVDNNGNSDTSMNRNTPHDYVLPSLTLTNVETATVLPSHSFPNGLVFDSRVYTPLTDVSPVQSADSGLAQHMAVMKDFLVPVSGSNAPVAPIIGSQPQSQTVAVGATANFNVSATGTAPLTYQWRYNTTNVAAATNTSYSISNAQTNNNGNYTVVISNTAGSVTSAVAVLTVTNLAPSVLTNPASLSVFTGDTVAFSVSAGGTAPLSYQWRFNSTNILSATNTDYSFNNAQTNDAGNYTVVVTNATGSVTSAVAVLTVSNAAPFIITQPASQTVSVGVTAAFSVNADGAALLDYQWRFNGTNITGATATNYSLASVQSSNAGNYTVVITNLAGSITSSVAVLTVNTNTAGTNIIAQWNFNSSPADGSSTTGSTTPSVGSATASTVGGITSSFVGGGGADTAATDNTAWTTTGYPNNVNNKTAGVQFAVSTVGKENISVSWSSQASNTGSKYGHLQYTTNGTDYTDFSSPVTNNAGSFSTRTNSLTAITSVNNNANFAIRIVAEFESTAIGSATTSYVGANGTYGTGGTVRFDMVTISGSTIIVSNPPASAPDLAAPSYSNNLFSFTVTGTATTNYVVQACTNLLTTNWIPVFTNAAPFTYTQTNANSFQMRFFRAKLP